jgi:hypothetical protein
MLTQIFGALFPACVLFLALFQSASYAGPLPCHETPGSYTNSDGQEVHRPECVTTHQEGETAICNDGSHSFSKHQSGTCSHHGGVAQWE